MLRSYSYAPGYDNIISMTSYGDDTNTYFYIRNHNNSVVALVDENGDIAESYEYDAYGAVTVFDSSGNELDESALGNRYTFQGREIDWFTGFYNFRARWYDAETGRWLSKDPIGIRGGFNQYIFCGNNPVMFVDPEGLFHFGKRPLKGVPWVPGFSRNPIYGYLNAEISHEHGFFDDGSCDNIGFRPDGRFSEDPDGKGYKYDDTHYDDDLMREALKNVEDGEYNLSGWGKGPKNNCQDWAERLRDEYEDLKKERAGGNSK